MHGRKLTNLFFRRSGLLRTDSHKQFGLRSYDRPQQCARLPRSWLFLLYALIVCALSACDVFKSSVMNHAGPIAANQWHLYTIVGTVLIFVAGPVLLLTPLIAWHYRLSNKDHAFKPKWSLSWTLEAFIWIPPIGIVIGLSTVLWHYTHMLDPYRPIRSKEPALELQAVALDWKWLIIYPEQRIATVKQMVIPVGRSVHITLTSATVMQALLIPQLAGQIYAMAGMRTQLNLAASRAGVFHGENTQYNGIGFQNDKLEVIALSASDYARWAAHVRSSASPLDTAALAELFRQSSPGEPMVYSSVPQHLFENILNHSVESGS